MVQLLHILLAFFLFWMGEAYSQSTAPEPNQYRLVYDSDSFNNRYLYPLGSLQEVDHGRVVWRPATGTAIPGEIVEVDHPDAGIQYALRRHQSAEQPTHVDYLDFPPIAEATLTVSFDARVSTPDSRTLDVFVMRPEQSQPAAQAAILIWGHDPGYLSYFDGSYRRLVPLDTEWRHYEMIINLRENTFDLRIDGDMVATGLGWRNRFPPDTAFGRLRIGSIRGEAGDYADITNLRITSSPTPPAIEIMTPLAAGGLVDPEEGFHFRVFDDSPLAPDAIQLLINGEDLSDNLQVSHEDNQVKLRYTGLEAGRPYAAHIHAHNEHGVSTRDISFYTYTDQVDGYRGIWFTLGQLSGVYGDKYSAGSAFAWSHTLTPMAVYAPEVDKTFFVYGGVTDVDERYLLIMASYYDHANHQAPRPTIVRDQRGVDDPHDNPSIAIAEDGHVWVFIAGRGRARPGQIFRSAEPYSVEAFEKVASREQTYSQIWTIPDRGFFHLLTKYTRGRELYWETSADGFDWGEQQKLAGFGGHYQVSRSQGDKVGTAFNYHAGGSVDRRTNLYYMETSDFGQSWQTVSGEGLDTPLSETINPALVIDYEARDRLVYVLKLLFDEAGHPVIMYVTSSGFAPGPDNDPRRWKITRWDGETWRTSVITESDHNYDVGSLYLHEDHWAVIAPALTGPQPYFTGGEVGYWVSTDQGATWELEREVTQNSPFNHSYVRRPHNPQNPFYALWADGDSSSFSKSRLYFTNADGTELYMLPYTMEEDYATPERLAPPIPPQP